MTQNLFWDDPYKTECKATVTAISGRKVKLDQTVFFAFCGGQESDEGTIGGIAVVNAVKLGDKENIIDMEYELEKEPDFNIGDEVDVIIDKERRLQLMKLHTATHIAYYFITKKFGKMKIIGSNIAPTKGRIDFASEVPLDDLEEVESKLNSYLFEGHDIVRTQDENSPDLRWWQCGDWKMPCGGTHVANTKEVGRVKLKRKSKGSGKERVEIYLE